MMKRTAFEYCGFPYIALVEDGMVRAVIPSERDVNRDAFKGDIKGLKPNLGPFSDFEKRVMKRAMEIPRGKVATYGELAKVAGRAGAAQAVGNVMARNPIPIIVPCHRVVRSDLTIGGYAHGSEKKQMLLKAEGVAIENGRVSRKCLHRF